MSITTELLDGLAVDRELLREDERSALTTLTAQMEARGLLSEAVYARISSLGGAAFARLADHSRETPTHWKWNLGVDRVTGIQGWIHQYKEIGPATGATFALSMHTHRYSFASRVLVGGFDNEVFDVRDDADGNVEWAHRSTRVLRAGDAYSLHATAFHRLSAVEPGSLTVLFQLPTRRVESFSVDPGSRRLVCHREMSALRADLIASLHAPQEYSIDD